MNNAAPENTAALQEKIAELEQQLKLSDEGASHLAERCLSLEQKGLPYNGNCYGTSYNRKIKYNSE